MGNSSSKCGCSRAKAVVVASSIAVCALAMANRSGVWQIEGDILRVLMRSSWGYLFGSSIWSGLVSAKSIRTTLPTHLIGDVQGKSFLLLHGVGTIASSLLFLAAMGRAPNGSYLPIFSFVTYVSHLLNLVYFIPKTIEVMRVKQQLEKKYNIGMSMVEDPKNLAEAAKDDKLKEVKKSFGKYHGIGMICSYIGVAGLFPFLVNSFQ